MTSRWSALVAAAAWALLPHPAPSQHASDPGEASVSTDGGAYCEALASAEAWPDSVPVVTELSRDGSRVYVGHAAGGRYGTTVRTRLRVLDHATGGQIRDVDLGSYGRVTDVWTSHEGTRIWVAAESEGRVITVEATTGEVLMMWVVGTDSPQRGTVSADDRHLYVSNRDAGTVTFIDRVTTGAKTVELEPGLSGLSRAPDRRRELWVANREMDRMTVLDARNGAVLSRFGSGGLAPVDVAFHPSGEEVWVVHHWSAELAVFDASTRGLLDVVRLEDRPVALRFSPGGGRAYVGLEDGGVLSLDPETRRVEASAPGSRELPGRLAAARAAIAGCTGAR